MDIETFDNFSKEFRIIGTIEQFIKVLNILEKPCRKMILKDIYS